MVRIVVSALMSLGVIAILLALTDTTAIYTQLKNADLGWLGLSLLALTIVTFLMALRWQWTAHSLDLPLSYWRALREYYLCQLVNQVVPGGIAGDASRAFRLREKGDLIRAAQSVMIERLIGQTTLFAIMFAGFAVALALPGGIDWPGWAAPFLVTVLVVAVSGICLWLKFATGTGPIVSFIWKTATLMMRPSQLFVSAWIAGLILFSFYAAARATGTVLPTEALVTLIPLLLTTMLIPFSLSGWGWREGAAAALFPLVGAFPSAGISAGIAYGAVLLVQSLPALLLMHMADRQSDPASTAQDQRGTEELS